MQSYPFKTRDLHNKLTQNNFHLDQARAVECWSAPDNDFPYPLPTDP